MRYLAAASRSLARPAVRGSRRSVVTNVRSPERASVVFGKPVTASGGYAAKERGAQLSPWVNNLGPIQADEVDIKVTHNGICHTDIHMVDNDWYISKYPFIPGHEVVGEVLSTGPHVKGLQPGQRVGVGWLKSSCRCCPACIRGEENLCDEGYTGTIVQGGNGGFQAVLRMPADFAFPIPEALDSAHAAPLLCAGVTVFAPLKQYMTRPGMSVGIVGIGGLGHLAIQFAAAMGGIVTAMGHTPSKAQEAVQFGAARFEVMDTAAPERLKSKFDLILNCATTNLPVAPMLAMLRNDGVLCQVGIPGDQAQMTVPLIDLVFGQKKLVGSVVGGRSDMRAMFDLAAAKGIKPLIEVVPSTKFNEAMARVKACKARYRVVVEMMHGEDPNLIIQ